MREPRAQLLDISARTGKEVCPLSCRCRTGGALEASGCFHFYFLKPPLRPFKRIPQPLQRKKQRHFCQMHIVFLQILFVLAASFLAAISLANCWGMFVKHKLGPRDLISSSRPVNVNNNPSVFFFGPRCSDKLSRLSKSLLRPPSPSGVTQVMTFPTTVIPGREK